MKGLFQDAYAVFFLINFLKHMLLVLIWMASIQMSTNNICF